LGGGGNFMGEENEKKAEEEQMMKKRYQYLEMASIVNTLLEKRYFRHVMKALKEDKQADFEKICDSADIPDEMRNLLWEMLKKVWMATNVENPWMTPI
jgi:hypothetical protein